MLELSDDALRRWVGKMETRLERRGAEAKIDYAVKAGTTGKWEKK